MARRRRKISVSPQSGVSADINITPMVDVVLVLLIIFMVVTPLLEKDIEVRVPDSEQVEVQQEMPDQQVVVSVTEAGELRINQAPMPDQATYVTALTRMLAARPQGERLVFFTADGQANYARLVAALDGARQAGAETLGMATELAPPPAP